MPNRGFPNDMSYLLISLSFLQILDQRFVSSSSLFSSALEAVSVLGSAEEVVRQKKNYNSDTNLVSSWETEIPKLNLISKPKHVLKLLESQMWLYGTVSSLHRKISDSSSTSISKK